MSNLADAFKRSILSSQAASLARDYSEVAIDALLNDGVIKDIPIIGSIINVYKLGTSIKEQFTIKKITKFLECLNDVSDDEKEKFLFRLNQENDDHELFEKLLIFLESLDDALKAEMMGNLFRVYIMDVIDRKMLLRCCNVIDKAYIDDLVLLHSQFFYLTGREPKVEDRLLPYEYSRIDSPKQSEIFYNLGVVNREFKIRNKLGRSQGELEVVYQTNLNSVGKALASFMLYNVEDPNFKEYLEKAKQNQEKRRN